MGNHMTFNPTALLVIEHNITGLKYFCKTARFSEINHYKGSGLYWKRHMKKHGKDVKVGVLGIYFDKKRCLLAAKKFSEENKIGNNLEWANLIPENGMDGAPMGEAHPMFGKPHPQIGVKRPWVGKKGADNPMWGKPSSMRGVPKPKGVDSPLYGRKRPEGGGKKSHPVIRIDEDGTETRYDSVADAGRAMNGCRTGIHQCCNGKSKTAHGYKWRYAKEIA
jgi:hypothetical protein